MIKFYSPIVLACCLWLPGSVLSASVDWIEPTGGQFGSAANWSSDPSTPVLADDIYFRVADAPAYTVFFDSPSVNPSNNTITVAGENRVTMNLGGQNYGTVGNLTLNGAGAAAGHLAFNGGSIAIGNQVLVGGNGSLTLSNSAVMRMGHAFYCSGSGVTTITGSGTILEMAGNALDFDANGDGNALFVVADGATLKVTSQTSCYITSNTNNTSMLLVTNGATFIAATNQHAITHVASSAGKGGRITIAGNGSLGVFDAIDMLNHGMVEVGAGSTIVVFGGRSLAAHGNSLVTGGGKITSQTWDVDLSFGLNLFDNACLAPGDSGTGTLTVEDSSNIRFQDDNTSMRVSLAGKAAGEFGRLVAVSDKTDASEACVRFEGTNHTIEVSVLKSYFPTASVGDTFDLIEATDLKNAANTSLLESDVNFPILDIVTPKFDGELSIETVGSRKVLRLTMTKVIQRGSFLQIR